MPVCRHRAPVWKKKKTLATGVTYIRLCHQSGKLTQEGIDRLTQQMFLRHVIQPIV
jgi:hypothetical protein